MGFPPKIDDFFGTAEPTGSAHDPGWDYRLWVDESAELYLGTGQFDSLQPRFASTPGVDAVAHMDREVFLLRSKLDAARLRELLWPRFVEAAKAGAAE